MILQCSTSHGAAARKGARVMGRLRRGRQTRRCGSVSAKKSAARNFSVTRPRAPKASSLLSCVTAGRRCAKEGREWRCGAQPVAVLCRIRRPGRRYRRDDGRRRAFQSHRHPKTSRRCVCAHRHVEEGTLQGRHQRSRSKSITAAAARSAKTTRRRICCTKRCARCSAITWRRRARWSRPTDCVSTSRIRSR